MGAAPLALPPHRGPQLRPGPLLRGYPQAAAPSGRVHRGIPRGRAGRSAPRGAHRLRGDGQLFRGPLPGRRELLPCARSSSCADLGARGAVLSHLSLPSPSCCCTAVRPFLPSALAQRTRRRSRLSSGSAGPFVVAGAGSALTWAARGPTHRAYPCSLPLPNILVFKPYRVAYRVCTII